MATFSITGGVISPRKLDVGPGYTIAVCNNDETTYTWDNTSPNAKNLFVSGATTGSSPPGQSIMGIVSNNAQNEHFTHISFNTVPDSGGDVTVNVGT